MLDYPHLILAIFASALAILATRAFPFLLFSHGHVPAWIRFVERYIPPMVMAILLVYCLKDVTLTTPGRVIPTLTALAVCTALHLWRRSPLLSIFASTAVYMALSHLR
jgi:branched-subunit amino acid transport protein AzlD